MNFTDQVEIGLGSKLAYELRAIMSEWVSKVPQHPYGDLGTKAQINKIVHIPCYQLKLTSQYKSEDTYNREKPYRGEQISDFVPEDLLNGRMEFLNKTQSFVVPGSARVGTCIKCSGKGRLTCNKCQGVGERTCGQCKGQKKHRCRECGGTTTKSCSTCNGTGKCHTCKGTGKKSDICFKCYGTGQIEVICKNCDGTRVDKYTRSFCYKCDYRGRVKITCDRYQCKRGKIIENCYTCAGTGNCRNYKCNYGEVKCTNCNANGLVNCQSCGATGRIRCDSCRGKGYSTCSRCKEAGKILSFTEIIKKWTVSGKKRFYLATQINNHFPAFKVRESEVGEKVETIKERRFQEGFFQKESEKFQEDFHLLLQSSIEGQALTKLNLGSRVDLLHQQLDIYRLDLFKIDYTYQKEDLQLLVIPKTQRVFEEDGPITRFKNNLAEKGEVYLKKRNFGKSMTLLNQALEMDLDTSQEDIQALREKVKMKITSSYRMGLIMGIFPLLYLLGVSSFDWIRQIPYGLSILNETQSLNPNLPTLEAILFVLLLLISSFRPFRIRLAKKMGEDLGHKISPEIFRYLAGAILGIGWVGLSFAILILLHISGLLFFPALGLDWIINQLVTNF